MQIFCKILSESLNSLNFKIVRNFIGFTFLLYFTFCNQLLAQNIEKKLVSLKRELLCFSQNYKQYVAYNPTTHQNSQLLHFWLKPSEYTTYDLILHLQEEAYWYINHNLQRKLASGWHRFSLDSLSRQYGCQPIFCTLYARKGNFLKEIAIGYLKNDFSRPFIEQVDKSYTYTIRRNAVVLLIALLLGYAVLRQIDFKLLMGYLQLSKFWNIQRRMDNPLFLRPFADSNILFLLNYAFLLAIFFYFLGLTSEEKHNVLLIGRYLDRDLEALSIKSLAWAFAIILVGSLIKFLLISTMASLLGISRIINIHFYEYIRISHFFYLSLTLFLLYLALQVPFHLGYWHNFFKLLLGILYAIRFIAVGVIINKLAEFRKLYFYSYLCIVELFPLFFYWKLLFFS